MFGFQQGLCLGAGGREEREPPSLFPPRAAPEAETTPKECVGAPRSAPGASSRTVWVPAAPPEGALPLTVPPGSVCAELGLPRRWKEDVGFSDPLGPRNIPRL